MCCTGASACNATQQGAIVGSYTDGIGMQDIDGVTLVAGEVRSYVEGLQLASGWLTGNHPRTGGVITYMRHGARVRMCRIKYFVLLPSMAAVFNR